MKSPFGEPCPWPKCRSTITRAIGDVDEGDELVVRCAKEHRSRAKRSARKIRLEPIQEESGDA